MAAEGQWLAVDRQLEADLTALARRLDDAGRAEDAKALRERLTAWTEARRRALDELREGLGVHHEINNALVGVSGNAQLLLLGPAAELPGVRERVQVVLREATRIKEAAMRLRELRGALGPGDAQRRAA